MNLIEHGVYFVKDQYFEDFPSEHWMFNKGEKRPHYYALKDTKRCYVANTHEFTS